MLNDNSGEIGRRRLKAAHERDVIIHNARLEAQKILSEAEEEKSRILEEARAESEQLKTNAYGEGLRKGISEKSELIENLSQYLSQSIEQLKRDEYEYFEEYAVQLKYIAVEIAEKMCIRDRINIICRDISVLLKGKLDGKTCLLCTSLKRGI